MFFVLSKILSFVLSPLIWIIFLLIIGLIVKDKRLKLRYLLASLFVTILFSNSFIVDEFYRLTESEMVRDDELVHYEAGIVLGGNIVTMDRKYDRLIFRDNPDRLFQAIRLYKAGILKNIMISGGSGSLLMPEMKESPLVRKILLEIGIPDSNILVDSLSKNTFENAIHSKDILEKVYPEGKCLLITSALHMPRAAKCFKKQDISFDIFPVGKETGFRRWDFGYLFIPKVGNLKKWEQLQHEWVGMLMYWFNGYI